MIWADEPGDRLLPDREHAPGAARVRQPGDERRGVRPRSSTLMRHLAEHDPLTGLRNRRGLQEHIDAEIARAGLGRRARLRPRQLQARQRRARLRAGRRGAAPLRRSCCEHAPRGLAARLGGEEFALVLPGRAEDAAMAMRRAPARGRPSARSTTSRGRSRPRSASRSAARAPRPPRWLLRAATRACVRGQAARPRPLRRLPRRGARRPARLARGGTATAASSSPRRCCWPRRSTCATSAPRATRRRSAATPRASPARSGCPRTACERIRAAGVLHDIGKLGVADAVLKKPGALTDDGVGRDAPPSRARRADPRRTRTCATSAAGCSPTTSASTAAATRTGWPATRSRSRRGSSPSPTPTRR